MKRELLTYGIFPVMMQQKTSTMMLSTPSGKKSFYTKMMLKVDPVTKKPILNVVRVGAVCEMCEKTETPWLCNHETSDVPPWKSWRKERRLRPLYEGMEDIYAQENKGVILEDPLLAFQDKIVNKFFIKEAIDIISVPKSIWIAGDPSGGGKSDMSMCAGIFVDAVYTVSFLFLFLFFFLVPFFLFFGPFLSLVSFGLVGNLSNSCLSFDNHV